MLTLPFDALLHRLYHEEQVRVFDPREVRFYCSYSHEHTANALKGLGENEVRELLAEEQVIEVNCQFCSARYLFTEMHVAELFPASPASHLN